MGLVFITGNLYKFEVSRPIAEKLGITLVQEKLETPEIQSDEVNEVASYSAKWAAIKLNKPVIVTDVGYYIDSLNGFPGPFIKYINKWLTPDDLLSLMKDKKNRKVTVKWCLAYCEPGSDPVVFESKAVGKITNYVAPSIKPDATSINRIFIPEGFNKTDAEIPKDEMVKFWANRETICWKNLAAQLGFGPR